MSSRRERERELALEKEYRYKEAWQSRVKNEIGMKQ